MYLVAAMGKNTGGLAFGKTTKNVCANLTMDNTPEIKVHGFDGQNSVMKTVQLHDSDQFDTQCFTLLVGRAGDKIHDVEMNWYNSQQIFE